MQFFFIFFSQIKRNEPGADFVSFRSVLSLLSYMCKAPLVPKGTPVINSLFRQRTAIENILRACVGLPPNSHIALEQRVSFFSEISSSFQYKKKHSFKQRKTFYCSFLKNAN